MTDFTPGFVARHEPAVALRVGAPPPPAFAAVDLRERAAGPRSFFPQGGPKHFSPAEPGAKPTAGWNPLDAHAEQTVIDPVAEARAAGYAEGLAAAAAERAAADAARVRDEALLAGLSAELGGGRIDREAIAGQLRAAVLTLVTRIVGEVGIAPDILAARIDAATKLLADAAESALLRVHPDDVALLHGRLPANVFAVGDPHLARGSFALESASTLVEDGPDLWLAQLEAAIDAVPTPPAC
jgi:flagellar assembly protein FliH